MKIRYCQKEDLEAIYKLICELEECNLNHEQFALVYKNKLNETRYISFYHLFKFDKENTFSNIEFLESSIWNDKFSINYSNTLNEILKQVYPDNNYKVLWSAEN